jgi:lipopolysaccharide transport system ATP-binding protein
MSAIITVENLSKKYRIRHQKQDSYATLRDTIVQGAKSIFSSNRANKQIDEEFWALKNVSFEINQGDRIGIIGRNGAGKSTLLKILSRVVYPTEGRIMLEGKIASLLEVGTGFHPELSGRENIYLNGVILGMTRKEIEKKFDEIVAFSEIDKFLDMPVKRYSSGMFVRLAFSVAVHMEPDILIVDEVLAVGDAQFQKKSAAKMESISKDEGRTILFVSHNMPAMVNLCPKSIYLEKGTIKSIGVTEDIINEYLLTTNSK